MESAFGDASSRNKAGPHQSAPRGVRRHVCSNPRSCNVWQIGWGTFHCFLYVLYFRHDYTSSSYASYTT